MKVLAALAPFTAFAAGLIMFSINSPRETPLERSQYDGRSRHIFAVAQALGGELDEIDAGTHTTVAKYALPGCEQPRGLVLDPNGPYAYIACAVNPALVKFNLLTHRIVAKSPYELKLREDATAASSSPKAWPGWR